MSLSTSLPVTGQVPVYRDQPASSGSPPTRDKIASEDKNRTRRVQYKRDRERVLASGRSFSEDFASILPSWRESKLSSEGRGEYPTRS